MGGVPTLGTIYPHLWVVVQALMNMSGSFDSLWVATNLAARIATRGRTDQLFGETSQGVGARYLTLPSLTALHLGAIHNIASVQHLKVYVGKCDVPLNDFVGLLA